MMRDIYAVNLVFQCNLNNRIQNSRHTYFCSRLPRISLQSANSKNNSGGLWSCLSILWHFKLKSAAWSDITWCNMMPWYLYLCCYSVQWSMLPWQIFPVTLMVLAGQVGPELHWPLAHQEVLGDPVTCSEWYLSCPETHCWKTPKEFFGGLTEDPGSPFRPGTKFASVPAMTYPGSPWVETQVDKSSRRPRHEFKSQQKAISLNQMHMLDLLFLLSVPLDQWVQVDPAIERKMKSDC